MEKYQIQFSGSSILDSRYSESDLSNNPFSNNITQVIFSKKINLFMAYDVFQPREPVKYLVEDLIAENSVNLWYGMYGTKKTFLALSVAVCVCLGKEWCGLKTQKAPVLIVDEESGTHRLSDRLQMAIVGENGNKDIPYYISSLSGFNFFRSVSDAEDLKTLIVATKSRLVIIDALSEIMAGGDENSVKDTIPVLLALRKICEETQSSIVIIHHSNKQRDYRGSSAIPGAVDTMVKIESETGSQLIKLKSEKNRDGEPFEFFAEIQLEEDRYYIKEARGKNKGDYSKIEKQVIDYMKLNNDELLLSDFLATAPNEKISEQYRNAVNRLAKKEKIRPKEGNAKGHTIYYLPN